MGSDAVLVVLAAGRARRYGGVKPLAPIGVGGEAVIDLLAADAIRAGFSTLVLVVGPATGPAIRYHVERTWPEWIDVRFAVQTRPLGTVHAVLAAAGHLREGAAFGVANADDCYGVNGLTRLAERLRGHGRPNSLVAYRLRNAVIGQSPVSRGICEVDDTGALRSLVERNLVQPTADGRFLSGDGTEPAEIDGDVLVSMNLWGFGTEMLDLLGSAMASADASDRDVEVLLPQVVGQALAEGTVVGELPTRFDVISVEDRCIGVTHPEDLTLVQQEVARQIGRGERAAVLWPVAM
ncbi:MAG: NTP transferase domain-containing protein [Actinomycetota bacterium]|jgi:CTP:molybdopterin cytidylyltransferase MocA|nr:NTP transferase domain-containing protein [Actinomycetota bacterium]